MIVKPGTVTETLTDPRYQPVRVVATLTEPVINVDAYTPHLDGPVAFGAYLTHLAEGGELPPMTSTAAADFLLPLATWTVPAPGPVHASAQAADPGLVWGWACSAGTYQVTGRATIAVRRRPAVDEAARYTADAKWHLSAGPGKARDIPQAATYTPAITWWALADPDPLRQALARVHGLGRLTRHGYGRVASWTVEVDAAAAERWRDRVWPERGGRIAAIRAPYHHPTRKMPCTVADEP